MSVIITGATGLIGAALVDYYNELGAEVISAARDVRRARGKYVRYDAEAPIDFEGVCADIVIHAACSAHPMAYSTDPAGVMRANITGTLNLLEYCRETGAKLVFLSSGEVYGSQSAPDGGFTEDMAGFFDSTNPRACYPISKLAAEAMIAAWSAQYGVNAVIARLCHTYGPNISPANTRADAQFLRKAVSGEDIIMKSSGEQARSYLYVKDAARAIALLAKKGARGEAYNIAGREAATVRDYAETLARLAGVGLAFENPSDAERAGYSRVPRAVLNPAKLEKLGFAAEYSLESGLRETYNAWRWAD